MRRTAWLLPVLVVLASWSASAEAPAFESFEKEMAVAGCGVQKSEGWYAWNDRMPPPPDKLLVVGNVQVANPGVVASLSKRVPQGINATILLLDLELTQKPGMWPQVVTWKPVRYEEVLEAGRAYGQVQVFCNDEVLQTLEVQDVH